MLDEVVVLPWNEKYTNEHVDYIAGVIHNAAEELGAKNFANRIRKKAIGGLEALLEARERREGVPAA